MKLLLKANFRVLRSSPATGLILLLFALIAGFISSFLYYGNVPMMRAYEESMTTANVEEFRFLPTLDLTESELAEIVTDAGIAVEPGQLPTVQELVDNDDVDLFPYYDSRADALAGEHAFSYEGVRGKVVDQDDVRYHVTTLPESIDRAIVVAGADTPSDGEILLTVQHARIAELAVGDSLTIGDVAYRIAGTYYQPSATLLGASGDSALGNASNAGVLMSAADFAAVDASEDLIFVGVTDGGDVTAVLDGLRASDEVAFVTASEHLPAISALRNNFTTSLMLMLIGTALFAAAVILVVWQILRNNLRRSVAVVGILKSMGLHPLSIAASFTVYVAPVLIGVLGGSFLGFALAPWFGEGYLDIFNFFLPPLRLDPSLLGLQLLLAIAVPLAVCMVTALRIVGAHTLRLLDGGYASSSALRLGRLSSAMHRLRLATRVRWSLALSNAPRLFVVIVSAALSVVVLAFSLAILTMAVRTLDQLRDSLDFDHLVRYSTPQSGEDADDVRGYADSLFVTTAGDATVVERSYDALFVDPSFDAITAADSDGEQVFRRLDAEGGEVIVSSKLAADFDLAVGDEITVQPQSLPEASLRVAGINPIAMDTRLYLAEVDLTSLVVGAEDGQYNTVFSSGETPPSDAGTTVTSKTVLLAQSEDAISASFSMVPLLALIAAVLSSGVLFLIAYLNVFDNRRMIALLDLLGYQAGDSVRLVINVYGMFILLGALAGALASPALLGSFGGVVSQASDYHLVLDTGWLALAVVVLAVAGLAQASHFLVLPWVRRISPAALAYA